MAWDVCRVCGRLRKVDNVIASDGWHQPPCYRCGDPAYLETLEGRTVVSEDFQAKAKRLVFEYIKPRLEKTDKHVTFASDEVYVVWWSKVLQNWKCLISTTLPDGMYYEVTYNG